MSDNDRWSTAFERLKGPFDRAIILNRLIRWQYDVCFPKVWQCTVKRPDELWTLLSDNSQLKIVATAQEVVHKACLLRCQDHQQRGPVRKRT
jgi:hypothetical protein